MGIISYRGYGRCVKVTLQTNAMKNTDGVDGGLSRRTNVRPPPPNSPPPPALKVTLQTPAPENFCGGYNVRRPGSKEAEILYYLVER